MIYGVHCSSSALFLFPFMVSDVFKALHGRTSLSWFNNTLSQFGIIWSLPVIYQVMSNNLRDVKKI